MKNPLIPTLAQAGTTPNRMESQSYEMGRLVGTIIVGILILLVVLTIVKKALRR